jgi:hypothetical protein
LRTATGCDRGQVDHQNARIEKSAIKHASTDREYAHCLSHRITETG